MGHRKSEKNREQEKAGKERKDQAEQITEKVKKKNSGRTEKLCRTRTDLQNKEKLQTRIGHREQKP